MNFASQYFKRFRVLPAHLKAEPSKNLNIIIIIPSYNEPKLINSLHSIAQNEGFKTDVEVIIVVNCSENSSDEIKHKNKQTIVEIENFIKINKSKIKFYYLRKANLPKKTAGVGVARKIGMDEAVHRFSKNNNADGIIVNFDADTLCEKNYIKEIENQFINYPKTNACSIHYEHIIDGLQYKPQIYNAIILYELYLHYYIQALRYIKFPYAFHTIGSAFAVKAKTYAKQGGMNTRKAGEDFYFLHKIIPLGNFYEIKNTTIFPSPRPSNRVPFGTGRAVNNIVNQNDTLYLTYNFQSFLVLKQFFAQINIIFVQNNFEILNIDKILLLFLQKNNFQNDLLKMKKNSSNQKTFIKRFYAWFNAFRILKFLNFSHESYFKKTPIRTEAKKLIELLDKNNISNLTDKKLLEFYRNLHLSTHFKNE